MNAFIFWAWWTLLWTFSFCCLQTTSSLRYDMPGTICEAWIRRLGWFWISMEAFLVVYCNPFLGVFGYVNSPCSIKCSTVAVVSCSFLPLTTGCWAQCCTSLKCLSDGLCTTVLLDTATSWQKLSIKHLTGRTAVKHLNDVADLPKFPLYQGYLHANGDSAFEDVTGEHNPAR